MKPASWPRDDARATRLLRLDPRRGEVSDGSIGDLRRLLRGGDLLVVNDAATLPASLAGRTQGGAPIELRLAGALGESLFKAVLFGAGDWRAKTEDRPPPPRLSVLECLQFEGLSAVVRAIDPAAPRLLVVELDARGAALWRALYRAGKPVQYAYARGPLALWHVQTSYAARPWAAEAPSAGFALSWELLLDLRARGVQLARLTHAAGLSSTGEPALDALFPLAERYDIPPATVSAVADARARGGRIIAVGTTVARALEGAAENGGGTLRAGAGTTSLRLGPHTRRRVVDAIATGMHEPATSHYSLLQSFADAALLERATDLAEQRGYLAHEFGDAMIILAE